MRGFSGIGQVGKDIWAGYFLHRVPRMAAALSYYTVFSIAPLLVIAIAIAGFFFGHEAATGGLAQQLEGLVGSTGAEAIEGMVESAAKSQGGLLATLIGLATLVFGATGVFGELQDSLNTIWEVKAKPGRSGIKLFLRTRLLSFTMVLAVGFLLLVSLLMSAALGAVGAWLGHQFPSLSSLVAVANILVMFVLSTLLFAMIFKLLPDVRLEWGDVWIGAAVTATFFAVGRWAIGLYIGNSAVASSYGAAGSLAVFLIWVYFSSQAFLLGAEFTKAFARTFGSHIEPKPLAEWTHPPEQAGKPPAPTEGGTGKEPSPKEGAAGTREAPPSGSGSGRLAPG